ncbi:2Fe-2S iron-sulfur cluster-binding protein [Roseinatronobacter alkalisoli]|uniref:2Fe-2S iron-sulfur cluster-binding protein n=1 Tax=Roseinatronobacter alkalisoli TaxID=3028235 RepID=A0ABT5TCJ5_9RHOB|nr:2Fe-2S iron-sulfur cluster-binding protein [Roseinatronobacter sp. HJB301]MDD7972851.1 2Fe-2S iron-sulfur cluster-binding protein [Roseinatronobacter sp. HJB301]
MGNFTLITRDGGAIPLTGRADVPLMEIIRDAGHEELIAMCGGCMSCATCHVYIDNVPAGQALPEMDADEDAMLDASDFRKPNSRLSCQVPWRSELSGVTVEIAPEE